MIKLNDVTLVAVASTKINETVEAINYSIKNLVFAKINLFTHFDLKTNSNIEIKKINQIKSIRDWSKFVIFELGKYIDTKFILLIHWDGFVVNPSSWRNEFLEYDYIGSPWPNFKKVFPKIYNQYPDDKYRVGNSVSIRSKKLLDMPSKINLNWENDARISNYHEDGYLCVQKRLDLENSGIKFAPFKLACEFGREYTFKENINLKPFVFHKWYAANKNYTRLSNKFSLKELYKRIVGFGYF